MRAIRSFLTRRMEVEMVVVLRMNRNFMDFMREHYPELCKALAQQHFGRTVVHPEPDQEEACLGASTGAATSSPAAGVAEI